MSATLWEILCDQCVAYPKDHWKKIGKKKYRRSWPKEIDKALIRNCGIPGTYERGGSYDS